MKICIFVAINAHGCSGGTGKTALCQKRSCLEERSLRARHRSRRTMAFSNAFL